MGTVRHRARKRQKRETDLLLVSFVGELDAHVVVFSDLRDDGSFAADNLGMKLWIYRHGDLETTQGLRGDRATVFFLFLIHVKE